jgi:hypothetical protein
MKALASSIHCRFGIKSRMGKYIDEAPYIGRLEKLKAEGKM